MPAQLSLDTLFQHRLLMVGGKGGVGKSTVAASLAVAAAQRGRKTLLVSTDPAHNLGDLFECTLGSSLSARNRKISRYKKTGQLLLPGFSKSCSL